MFTHTRILALVATLTLFAGCAAMGSGKGVEDDAPQDGKYDLFWAPTEHGTLAFGERVTATIEDGARFHAWDWTLTAAATLTIETFEAGDPDMDTVIYLYRKQDDDRWGRFIRRNDDGSSGLYSLLRGEFETGEYRLLVKHYGRLDEGTFALKVECEGSGCGEAPAPPPAATSALRVPLLDENDYTALAKHNAAIVAAGHEALPVFVEVTPDSEGATAYSNVVDRVDAIAGDVEAVSYPIAYALPGDYAGTHEGQSISLCYTGDPARIVGGIYSLTDSVFSDQLTIYGHRYGDEQWVADEDFELDVSTFPTEWRDFDGSDGHILLVIAYSDSGHEQEPATIAKCSEAPLDVAAITRRVLEEAGLAETPFDISADEVQTQIERFGGSVGYETALRGAIWSFLNDGEDLESPIEIVNDLDGGPCLQDAPADRVRCFANRSSAELTIIATDGWQPEGGENVSDWWIFHLYMDELSDHSHWALVDREGVRPTYNYGFN